LAITLSRVKKLISSYSLGSVLCFLVTGEEPFEDDYTDDEKWVKLFMGGK
jgi:hypothetical protein